jgi:hypothetical protein
MYNNEFDAIKSETMSNNMKEYGEFKINDFNFMPTVEVLPYGETNPDPSKAFLITDIMSESDDADTYKQGWYSPFPVDVDLFLKYVEPVITFRRIIDRETSYIMTRLRRCTADDFESRGYVFKSDDDRKKATFRLCPPFEKLDFLKIKNEYLNKESRMSFSIEFHLCDPEYRSDCKPNQKVKNMLDHLMFNIYVLSDSVEMGNPENYKESPLVTVDTFHSQFKL